MEQILKGYSWDLGEYKLRMSKAEHGKMTMQDAFRAYQMIPAPSIPEDFDTNDYIRQAQETKELKYVFFYLHENEKYFNERINAFLSVETDKIHPERFMDLKMECRMEVLLRFPSYNLERGATFLTFIHRYIGDTLLRFRKGEEYHSFDSLQEYKDARRIMQIYAECSGNAEETIRIFAKQDGCSEKTAEKKLMAAWRQRNRLIPARINEEGESWEQEEELIPDHWDFIDILWAGAEAVKVDKAFDKLSFKDKTLLEKRNAICMTCGRVSDMKTQLSFERLAEMFEGSGASGAERAYKRSLEKLMLELVKLGQLHCVQIRQESVRREGKKITAAVYGYQVDNGGEWGEIRFDLTEKTAWVETFAEKDPCDTWAVTEAAIQAVLECDEEKLPKKMMIPVAQESNSD